MGIQLPSPKKGADPQFSAHLYWMHQDATWYGGVGLSPGDSALDGDLAPSFPQRGWSPSLIFSPFLLWPNGWMHQNATWYSHRPQPRRLCVRWEPSPLPQKGLSATHFSVHVYCGQTAAWIKMPLGAEVGLGVRNIVFDVDPAIPRKKGHTHLTQFLALLWPNGWMD